MMKGSAATFAWKEEFQVLGEGAGDPKTREARALRVPSSQCQFLRGQNWCFISR